MLLGPKIDGFCPGEGVNLLYKKLQQVGVPFLYFFIHLGVGILVLLHLNLDKSLLFLEISIKFTKYLYKLQKPPT